MRCQTKGCWGCNPLLLLQPKSFLSNTLFCSIMFKYALLFFTEMYMILFGMKIRAFTLKNVWLHTILSWFKEWFLFHYRLNFSLTGFAFAMMDYCISKCVFLTLLGTFAHSAVFFALCQSKKWKNMLHNFDDGWMDESKSRLLLSGTLLYLHAIFWQFYKKLSFSHIMCWHV